MNFIIDALERRFFDFENFGEIEIRENDGTARAVGYGVVYDRETEIFPGFFEKIKRGAFENLSSDFEIKSFFNHDPSMILSTTESDPPLIITENNRGVKFDSPIPPTSYGEDLKINLSRKNVRGASFSFTVSKDGDIWNEDKNGNIHREVVKARLYELGPVTNPAYKHSSASLRSLEETVKEYRDSVESKRKLDHDSEKLLRDQADLEIKIRITSLLERGL